MTNKTTSTINNNVIILPGQAVIMSPSLSLANGVENYKWEYVKFQIV